MEYVVIALVSYLLGTSSMSYYLGKINKVDIRNKGSKNLGASNAMILMGWKAGALVAVHDAGKALLAVVLAKVIQLVYLVYSALIGVLCAVYNHHKYVAAVGDYLRGIIIALAVEECEIGYLCRSSLFYCLRPAP